MEHSSALVIGFCISADDLGTPFLTKVPEKSHMEERFDPTNGKKLKPVKVVDEDARSVYVFDGETYEEDERYELAEALAAKTGSAMSVHGDACTGEDQMYAFEPKAAQKGEFTFAEVRKLEPECKRIRKAFAKLGIDLGEPGLFTLDSYG